MPHRPLKMLVAPPGYEVPADFFAELHDALPNLRVDSEVVEVIRAHIAAFMHAIAIARVTVDTKALQDQLKKLKARADNVLSADSAKEAETALRRLREILQAPRNTAIEYERARLFALLELAGKFDTRRRQNLGLPFTAEGAGIELLHCIVWDREHAAQLSKYAEQAWNEVARSNDEQEVAVKSAIGRILIDGKPFEFRGDPWKEKRAQPATDAKREFGANLMRIYCWMGGVPTLHRQGTGPGDPPPTDFMRFIQLVTGAIPAYYRPKGNTLLWHAAKAIQADRKAA